MKRLLPKSLVGQLLLLLAIALLAAQTVNLVLLYRAAQAQSTAANIATASWRIARAIDRAEEISQRRRGRLRRAEPLLVTATNPIPAELPRNVDFGQRMREQLQAFNVDVDRVEVAQAAQSPPAFAGRIQRPLRLRQARPETGKILLFAVRMPSGQWVSTAAPVRALPRPMIAAMMAQTFVLYLILLLPAIWLVRRVSRPLRALTLAARDFDPINSESLKPTGPQDTRDLTNAFNAMQQRVSQMLTEKDVMLGAIGHDLRTPLAVLRVRVENVEDAQERAAMAATIAELDASLSDILTFARLGRSAEGRENTDIGALVDTLIDEYGAPDGVISRAESQRMVAPVRALLIKRALRNLIGNALTYGGNARITLAGHADALDIMIDDDGPGIADVDIARLFEPFVRGEKSRNRATGGSGLGLTIARAIARSHGGDVTLANRPEGGLRATLRLPLSSTSQA